MTINILHIDDHELVRAGLRLALIAASSTRYNVVEAPSGTVGLALLEKGGVDLVVLDIALPDMNGLSLLAEARSRFDVPTCILSGQEIGEIYQSAKSLGAIGMALKTEPAEKLVEMVECAVAGTPWISSAISVLVNDIALPKILLSPRQNAVLHYLKLGETNKAIAYRLGISQQTVSFHLSELRRKFRVDHNRRLISAAKEAGL